MQRDPSRIAGNDRTPGGAMKLSRRSFLGRSICAGAAIGMGLPGLVRAHASWLDATLSAEDGFTIVGIPDVHVDFMCSEDRLTTLSEWIVARAQRLNIRFVAQLGDAGDRRGSGSLPEMLQQCRRGLAPIEKARIPLSVCIGNHDYDRPSSERANSAWNHEDAFGMSLYRNAPGFGGTFEQEVDQSGPDAGGTASHYFTLRAAGEQLLILNLELGPREKVMRWADRLVRERFPEHSVIVFTHSHLHTDGTRVREGTAFNPKGYSGFSTDAGPEYTHDGNDLMERYFRHWPRLRMVHSGHAIAGPRQAWLASQGEAGNRVTELFYNWQEWGYDEDAAEMVRGIPVPHGASMIRLFQVRPKQGTVNIANFLPSAGKEAEASIPESLPWG